MLVHSVDKDGDGHLDYEEFVKIMMAREKMNIKIKFWLTGGLQQKIRKVITFVSDPP